MKQKYNDKSKYFRDWSTKKLRSEAKAYEQQIYVIGWYGSKDIANYYIVLAVLESRTK